MNINITQIETNIVIHTGSLFMKVKLSVGGSSDIIVTLSEDDIKAQLNAIGKIALDKFNKDMSS